MNPILVKLSENTLFNQIFDKQNIACYSKDSCNNHNSEEIIEQAWAELCQAQEKLGQATPALHSKKLW